MAPAGVFQAELGIVPGSGWLWAERGVLGRFAVLGGEIRLCGAGMEKGLANGNPHS